MIVYVNAAGCHISCRHCSVNGSMPIGRFYSLDELRAIAIEWGPIAPYFEVTAHPDFPEIMDPQIIGNDISIMATTGFGLAERIDYIEVFDRLRDLGINSIFSTLHGLEKKHNWFVRRDGAFERLLKTSRKAAEAGLGVIWSVFLDRQNLEDIPQLQVLAKQEVGLSSLYLEIPRHRVSRRMAMYENLRPRLEDVKKLLQCMGPETWRGWLKDRPLEDITEFAWLNAWKKEPYSDEFMGRRDPKSWPAPPRFDEIIYIDENRQVFIDPQLGEPILLGKLSDGKDEIMRRIQQVPTPPFSDILPEDAKLAKDDSDLLHPHGHSVRCKAVSTAVYGNRTSRKS